MRFVLHVVSRPLSVALALTIGVLVASAGHVEAASPPTSVTLKPSPPFANARVLSGAARVLDGDTIDIATRDHGVVRIRLEGIDAPEGGQRCQLKWYGTWDCGRAATTALAQMTRDRVVTCDDRGPDKYGRTLGVCFTEGRDLNSEMVRIGLAWAFVRYSELYVAEERDARAAKIGVWQAPTQAPWDWRAAQKMPNPDLQRPGAVADLAPAQPAASTQHRPQGCDIKGNVTKSGRIYHTPDSPWYERVKMSLGFGRRWFCSEAEAQAAGWRPVIVVGQR